MKKYILLIVISFLYITSYAQENYKSRYDLLVSKLGYSGVGVETLLNKWEAAEPTSLDMFIGKFMYYYNKSQTQKCETSFEKKYLGLNPVLQLKDSLGRNVNFFNVPEYNKDLFDQALGYLNSAIELYPARLDIRETEIYAYIAYQRSNPSIAYEKIIGLLDYNQTIKPKWEYPYDNTIKKIDQTAFYDTIQEICSELSNIGTGDCMEYFKKISEKSLKYMPKFYPFMANLGYYYSVYKKEYKLAVKYYKKAWKLQKDDVNVIRNLIVIARTTKDKRLEKKMLKQLLEHTSDNLEKQSCQARLQVL